VNAIAFPVLSRIALRADHLLDLADAALRDGTRIDPALVWADATRIKQACDDARRAMAGAEAAREAADA
jgi:hypothetical protein